MPSSRYVLYFEINATRPTGVTGLRAVVVDASGAVVWMKAQTNADPEFANRQVHEPLEAIQLLADWLKPEFNVTAKTASAAQPGKFARLMEQRSGLPAAAERESIPAQQKTLAAAAAGATLLIVPVPVPDHRERTPAFAEKRHVVGPVDTKWTARASPWLAPGKSAAGEGTSAERFARLARREEAGLSDGTTGARACAGSTSLRRIPS